MMIDAEIYGMIPKRKNGETRKSATREHVEHAQDAALLRIEKIGQNSWGRSREPECAPDAIHDQRAEQEPKTALQIAELAALANGIWICCQRSTFPLTYSATEPPALR
jgi:hypothetical protein